MPLSLALAIGLAVLLNQAVKGLSVFRTVFFLPTIVPIVASAVLWLWVLNPESGLINGMLRAFLHIEGPGWIADVQWSKPSLILMSLWSVGGPMVIFLAGLAEVPAVLYEAADIDGAGPWQKFRNVTLPMLTPTILFNLVMGLIAAFQYFTQVYVMTAGKGTPADSTMFYALYLYRNSFVYLKWLCLGHLSALPGDSGGHAGCGVVESGCIPWRVSAPALLIYAVLLARRRYSSAVHGSRPR